MYSFPFPVLNGAENNMVDFALKENDSFFLCSAFNFPEMCFSLKRHSSFGFWSPFYSTMKTVIHDTMQEFLTKIFSRLGEEITCRFNVIFL